MSDNDNDNDDIKLDSTEEVIFSLLGLGGDVRAKVLEGRRLAAKGLLPDAEFEFDTDGDDDYVLEMKAPQAPWRECTTCPTYSDALKACAYWGALPLYKGWEFRVANPPVVN